jgi:hypothetical protein
MALDLEKYNEEVKQWFSETNSLFKNKAGGYGISHRSNSPSPAPSIDKFRNRFFLQDGAIVRGSINFPRTLIYVHKGAGKGRGGNKGSRWVDKYGNAHKTNPKSLGKMDSDGRKAKPFINDVLNSDQGIDKLATIVAEHLGDSLAGSLFIK